MNKRAIFIFCFILVLIIVFALCFYIGFNIDREEENNIVQNNTVITIEKNEINKNEVIETSISDEKTTPNTILILKKCYLDCGHTITNKSTISEEMVNLNEEEIKEKYPSWKLEEFSQEKIVFYKELQSFCGEHYLLTEESGYINIYTIDEGENKSLKEKTSVSVEYLPETDRISLRNGLMIYGTEELNKILEDFES